MNSVRTFLFLVAGALCGAILGGVFGAIAGVITPGFFAALIPWGTISPLGFATFCGATVGVVLGGAAAAFSLLLQLLNEKLEKKSR